MSEYHWGTLYFVSPDWVGDENDVIEWHHDFVSIFDRARDLWKLAGRPERAAEIDRVLNRAHLVEPVVLDKDALAALVAAFDGLREALVGTVLDQDLHIPAGRIPALRDAYPSFDLREDPSTDLTFAVGSALADALALGKLLAQARARGLHVWLGLDR